MNVYVCLCNGMSKIIVIFKYIFQSNQKNTSQSISIFFCKLFNYQQLQQHAHIHTHTRTHTQINKHRFTYTPAKAIQFQQFRNKINIYISDNETYALPPYRTHPNIDTTFLAQFLLATCCWRENLANFQKKQQTIIIKNCNFATLNTIVVSTFLAKTTRGE